MRFPNPSQDDQTEKAITKSKNQYGEGEHEGVDIYSLDRLSLGFRILPIILASLPTKGRKGEGQSTTVSSNKGRSLPAIKKHYIIFQIKNYWIGVNE